jgi:6,7-dimethyl-8-ribityllumazine synthase
MSDRFETPRWDDEPEELELGDAAVRDDPDRAPAASELDTPDLDASSENVLDGWPVTDPGDDEAAAATSPAAVTDTEAPEVEELDEVDEVDEVEEVDEIAEIEESGEADEDLSAPSPPLADHVSESLEHAPGELTVPPGYSVLEGQPVGARRAVGVVVSRFNGDVTTLLLESALAELEACGVTPDAVTVMPVPGAFELPLAAMALAKTRRFACIVALGCVIRGDTPHFDYVSSEAASGLQLAAIETGVPVAFGVLTLDRTDQAESRTTKGAEAVRTGLEMADLFANLRAAAAR